MKSNVLSFDLAKRRAQATQRSARALDRLVPSPTSKTYALTLEAGRIHLVADAVLEAWDARELGIDLIELARKAEGVERG